MNKLLIPVYLLVLAVFCVLAYMLAESKSTGRSPALPAVSAITRVLQKVTAKKPVTDSATVTSWEPAGASLGIRLTDGTNTFVVLDPKAVNIIIRRSASGEALDETIATPQNQTNWRSAFCPDDKLELFFDNSAKDKGRLVVGDNTVTTIRNLGSRTCRYQ